MDYFQVLNFEKEPFSNSPDPDFFFHSVQHTHCLQQIELAIRLRRGLNIVLGEVGTGKTTICRQILNNFDESIEYHLILDPDIGSPLDLLRLLYSILFKADTEHQDIWLLKEEIKKYLLQKVEQEQKIIVILIDEGQKFTIPCLEILRELLNFETNNYKLLQIVIFAQPEFEQQLQAMPNFQDRINMLLSLHPFNFQESRDMVLFRLQQAIRQGSSPPRFTLPALWAIYKLTGGYPRKIITLCHKITLSLIIQNKAKVTSDLVKASAQRVLSSSHSSNKKFILAIFLAAAILFFYIRHSGLQPKYFLHKNSDIKLDSDNNSQKVISAVKNSSIIKNNSSFFNIAPNDTESINKTTENKACKLFNLPQDLGRIKIKNGDNLTTIIWAVYGVHDQQKMQAYIANVLSANPVFKNASQLKLNDVLQLPAILWNSNSNHDGYWISLAMPKNLESGYRLFLELREKTDVRLICYWSEDKGLNYNIVLDKFFSSEKDAFEYKLRLKSNIRSQAKCINFNEKINLFSYLPTKNK